MDLKLKTSKIKLIFDNIYIPLLGVVFTSFWIFNFLNQEKLESAQNIEIIIIGVLALIVLLSTKDTYYVTPLILFTPFIYAKSFYINTTPTSLFIAAAIVVVGLICHVLIYKIRKIKFGCLFIGIAGLVIALIFGGLLEENPDKLMQMGIMFVIAICFLLLYIVLSSTVKKNDFDKVCYMLTTLGMMIVIQSCVFYFSLDDLKVQFGIKILDLGWGCSNNCAMMYLVTIPFTIYLVAVKKGLWKILFTSMLIFQGLGLIFTYSRGGIIAFAILILLSTIAILVFSENKIKTLICIYIAPVVFGLFMITLIALDKELLDNIVQTITSADFTDLNGRKDIYLRVWENFKESPLFGKGILASTTMVGTEEDYLWAHGTFFQTAESFGLFGLIALIIHLFQKYFFLLKNINFKKAIMMTSFLASGFYGLFDISYYYINYMVVIFVLFIFMDNALEDNEIDFDYIVLHEGDKRNSKYKEVVISNTSKEAFSTKNSVLYKYEILRDKFKQRNNE